MSELTRNFFKYVCQTSGEPAGLEVASGEGGWLVDTAGRRYLDWLAGIGVLNTGHRHPDIVEAVQAQLDRYLHVMVYGEYVQEPQVELARRLAALAPFPDAQVYFTSSGAEAVEGALKLARKHTRRAKVIAFENSYHGDTLGALSVLGRQKMREPFGPLLEAGFLPFGWEQALPMIDGSVAAVIVEPVQAEGGVRIPPEGFLKAVRERCDRVGALLMFDEVQTGLGRTGRMLAGEHFGAVPDLIVLAKALGGGLPLGAFVGRLPVMFSLSMDPPLTHLTTFGGHPVSCAAGVAALDLCRKLDLPRHARELGKVLVDTLAPLKKMGLIEDVRGMGLLVGVELESEARARKVVDACREAGLLVGTALHADAVLRLTPPLNISNDELVLGLDRLVGAITRSGRLD